LSRNSPAFTGNLTSCTVFESSNVRSQALKCGVDAMPSSSCPRPGAAHFRLGDDFFRLKNAHPGDIGRHVNESASLRDFVMESRQSTLFVANPEECVIASRVTIRQ
jgi:hypothetical protein